MPCLRLERHAHPGAVEKPFPVIVEWAMLDVVVTILDSVLERVLAVEAGPRLIAETRILLRAQPLRFCRRHRHVDALLRIPVR